MSNLHMAAIRIYNSLQIMQIHMSIWNERERIHEEKIEEKT